MCIHKKTVPHKHVDNFSFFKLSAVLRACIGTCVHVSFVLRARKEKTRRSNLL